jgi:hypothetical protein
MAAKQSGATLSKSDAVREYLASNRGTPVKQVAAALAEQGIEVSLALVNKIKYGDHKSLGRGKVHRRPGKSPVRRPESKEASKAQAIREALVQLGRRTRPRDVVAHLKDGGVIVSAAQVSAIRNHQRKGPPRATVAALAGKHSANGRIVVEHLMAAKRLADQLGLDAAKKALEVLARLAD